MHEPSLSECVWGWLAVEELVSYSLGKRRWYLERSHSNEGTGHVKGPVKSCHLTLVSAAHIGWKGEGSSIILERTLTVLCMRFLLLRLMEWNQQVRPQKELRYCRCWHFLRISSVSEAHFSRLPKIVPRDLYSPTNSANFPWIEVMTGTAHQFSSDCWRWSLPFLVLFTLCSRQESSHHSTIS